MFKDANDNKNEKRKRQKKKKTLGLWVYVDKLNRTYCPQSEGHCESFYERVPSSSKRWIRFIIFWGVQKFSLQQ